MPLSAAMRALICDALRDAPHGRRGAEVRRLADTLGASPATIYRAAGRRGTPRPRAPAHPEYREWVEMAVWVAHTKGPPGDPLPLDLAIEIGIEGGVLPPEAAGMPVSTARRIAREMGLQSKRRRTRRIDADYPMQAVQCDGSTSKHLSVEAQLPCGDWVLRRWRRPYPAAGYKNKPLGPDRERLIYYGLTDICTGYALSEAVVARGETAIDELTFLCRAFAGSEDPRVPFHGRPDDLWFDGGNLFRSDAAADFFERTNITPNPPSRGYHKERMGLVERSHRTRWRRFEATLFARDADTIRLSELNARLREYCVRENTRRPSRTRVAGRRTSRTAAWTALTNARPADNRLERFPAGAIETVAREKEGAWLDANGILTWGGEYEVDGWGSMHVTARRGLAGDQDHVIVEHPKTKERRVAYPLARRPYGTNRAVAKTPLDALLETEHDFAGADVYAPGRNQADPKVAAIPARSTEAAPIEDPLDAGRHPGIETAMAAFAALYPHPLRPEHRALVVERIEAAGCAKQAVIDLAQQLTVLARGGGVRIAESWRA